MPAIFISHSSKDNKVSDNIKLWLAKLGFERVFLDFDKDTGLGAGLEWEKQLYEEVARCHAVLLILTPNWIASKWCFVELQQARALGKVIIPVVCADLGGQRVLPDVQAIELIDWNPDALARIESRLNAIANELARGFRFDPSRPPYPGIFAFEAEDAAIYFGRDDETRAVIERLDARRTQGGPRFVLIVGASGSGKSSLLKAGVLPQLSRRRTHWLALPSIRPEKMPVEALARAIAYYRGESGLWREWHSKLVGPDGVAALSNLVGDIRIGEGRTATVLLSIDQFEELFTIADESERETFLKLLASAINPLRDLPLLAVATGRADVLHGLLEKSALASLTETFSLLPMPLERLPRLIEGPAVVGGLSVEKGLAERIVRDVENPDALPLLAYTLHLLSIRCFTEKRLTLDAYMSLGEAGLNPVQNSVRLAADQAVGANANEGELSALRDAFVPHLVRLRLDDARRVRRPAPLSDLPHGADRLIRALITARLLTVRSDGPSPIVEVAHEALFDAWPTLKNWLDREQSFLSDIERVKDAYSIWEKAPASDQPTALLSGLLLSRARDWLIKYPTRFEGTTMGQLHAFIIASHRRAQRRRIALSALGGLVFLLACAVVAPMAYSEYIRRTALDCDLYAAEEDNTAHVPGVEYDKIITDVAIPACERAVAAQSNNPRLIHNLARSLDKANRHAEAVGWYAKAADLKWSWSQNNLGILYLKGEGTARNFALGVRFIREAADQNNRQAIVSYTKTDFTSLFDNSPNRAALLEQALLGKGYLKSNAVEEKWTAALSEAIEAFKSENNLTEKGITLRVLDRLGVVDSL
jgi:hypothetical protein